MLEPVASAADLALVDALKAGDEEAYRSLVERYGPSMVRIASAFVPSRAVAEEVVQDAWIGVLRGLDRFEGRSSLKTWIFRILVNIAKTRGQREGRTTPFSSIGDEGPSVDPSRFLPPDDPEYPNWWDDYPRRWEGSPEERALGGEVRRVIDEAIDDLPDAQRAVISLRDLNGWDSDEVCNVLDIQQTNQRVLLHRARSKVRAALERYFEEETGS